MPMTARSDVALPLVSAAVIARPIFTVAASEVEESLVSAAASANQKPRSALGVEEALVSAAAIARLIYNVQFPGGVQ